jgi:V/A-type H+/Na+-transporting ATPase subunit C
VNPFYAASQSWVRARLSRLLQREAWLRLLDAGSSSEFSEILRGTWIETALYVSDGRLRRRVLRGEVAAAAVTLGRFLPRGAKQLLAWYNRRFEIENLKIVLRSVQYGVDRERATASLVPLRPGRLQWQPLLEASSVQPVLDRLSGSPYARAIQQATEKYQQEKRLFHLEIALDLFYFQRLVRLIERERGATGSDAKAHLGRWIAIQNLIWAYRFRIYGRMSPEEIVNYTLHRAFQAGLETVRRVALGAPLQAEAERLGFHLGPGLSEVEGLTELEMLAERERFRDAADALGRPLFGFGGILAYLTLLEAEIRDLGVIAEGKAAGLSRAEITSRLLRAV